MAIINTNLASLTAARSLQEAQKLQETSMERLSTGLRINSAADDATGLGISEGMTSQIRGINMAIKNAGAAVNLVDTADSALAETSDILQRMRELSVQAGNSTLSAQDRAALKVEMEALTAEIDRIASTTSYNKNSLLDGSAGSMSFQVGEGTGSSESVNLSISSAKAADLGLSSSSSVTTNTGTLIGADVNDGAVLSAGSIDTDDILINGVNWARHLTELPFTDANGTERVNTFAVQSAAGLALAINTNTEAHGVTASAQTVVVGGPTDGISIADQLIMEVTDEDGTTQTYSMGATTSIEDLVDEINVGGTTTTTDVLIGGISAVKNDAGGVTITSSEGATINFSTGGTLGFAAAVHTGVLTLSSADSSPITITRGTNTSATDADIRILGFNVTDSDSSVVVGRQIDANGALSATNNFQLTVADDMTINGVQIGATDTAVGAQLLTGRHLADAVNAVSAKSNVTATTKTEIFMTMSMKASSSAGPTNSGGGEILINGESISTLAANATVAQVVTAINSLSTARGMGITAEATASNIIKLTNDVGDNITVHDEDSFIDSITHADGSAVTMLGDASSTVGASDFVFGARLTFTNTAGGGVAFGHDNVTQAVAQVDFDKLGVVVGSTTGTTTTTTNGVDVSSVSAATSALTAIDTAIQKVNEIRGGLGALQNRLDHTVSNLTAAVQNHEASRSQILDADFAAESANLAKAQVLSQASTAMLAQANAAPQLVLQLLQ